ncbi:MAG: hypothetical protein MIL41_05070, partial [Hyphomicrobiales bacterium]
MPTWIFDTGVTIELFADARIAEAAHDEAPLTLEQATWIPELCRAPDAGELSPGRVPMLTSDALRGAIKRGDLVVEVHGTRQFVTKRLVREWRERCRTTPQPRSQPQSPSPSAPRPEASPAPLA